VYSTWAEQRDKGLGWSGIENVKCVWCVRVLCAGYGLKTPPCDVRTKIKSRKSFFFHKKNSILTGVGGWGKRSKAERKERKLFEGKNQKQNFALKS
jgi:hypothetical protein